MIEKKKSVVSIIILAVAVVVGTVTMAMGDPATFNYVGQLRKAMAGDNFPAHPMKFVGTFYGEADIITFHSDGTMLQVISTMFSDDPSSNTGGRKLTPVMGVWKKVANNTIRVTQLSFATEQFGHNYYRPDGGIIIRSTWLAIFDEPVNGVSPGYTFKDAVAEVFLPGQDPSSDEPLGVAHLGGGRAERLRLE